MHFTFPSRHAVKLDQISRFVVRSTIYLLFVPGFARRLCNRRSDKINAKLSKDHQLIITLSFVMMIGKHIHTCRISRVRTSIAGDVQCLQLICLFSILEITRTRDVLLLSTPTLAALARAILQEGGASAYQMTHLVDCGGQRSFEGFRWFALFYHPIASSAILVRSRRVGFAISMCPRLHGYWYERASRLEILVCEAKPT